jgi:inositol transport system substrate-binding protein
MIMKKTLRILSLCLATLFTACFSSWTFAPLAANAATPEKGTLTIAWSSPNMSNQFQVTLRDCVKKYVEAAGGRFLEADARGDAPRQVSQVENFIAQKVDVILLSPTDTHACVPAVTAANEAGIPIMIVNASIDNVDEAICYVGCNDISAGEMEMEYIAERLGGKGNIVVLQGPDGNSAAVNRTIGIANVLKKYPGIKLLAQQPANWDIELAMTTIENMLQTMDIDAIVSENDEMALGAVKAIQGQSVEKNILIIGVDAIADGLKAVNDGTMIATVLQDAEAIAAKTIEIAYKVAAGESVDKEYEIPYKIIDKENIAEYLK